ncbi:hypothetical protein B566_EDAN013299 [Ephemera danica]|nr:hypothetical protein B566_EDAN013299 [Ephemera danica]
MLIWEPRHAILNYLLVTLAYPLVTLPYLLVTLTYLLVTLPYLLLSHCKGTCANTRYSTNSKTAYWTSLNNHDGALTLRGNGKSVGMLMGMFSSFGAGNKNSGNCIAYTSNQAKLFRLSAGECKTQHYFICKIPAHCL